MRYMAIYKTVDHTSPPTPEEMARMGAFVDAKMKAGVLIDTGGCAPSALGARVRSSKGKHTVTDGPFTETKEVIAGFAILECATKEEAIREATEFLKVAGGEGESEVRLMMNCR